MLLLILKCSKAGRGGRACQQCLQEYGNYEITFYAWKKKYGELGASVVRRLRQLEEENALFKRLLAVLMLDKNILQ